MNNIINKYIAEWKREKGFLERNLQKIENDYVRIVNHCIQKIYYYERTPEVLRNRITVQDAIK